MGNEASKSKCLEEYLNRFNQEERNILRSVYTRITKDQTSASVPQKHLTICDLLLFLENKLPESISKRFFAVLSFVSQGNPVSYAHFVKVIAYLSKGDVDERQDLFINILLPNEEEVISITQFKEFLLEISEKFINILSATKQYKTWKFETSDNSALRVSQLLFYDFLHKVKNSTEQWNSLNTQFDKMQISNWFSRESLFTNAMVTVFNSAFQIYKSCTSNILPTSSGADWKKNHTLLDLASIIMVNNYLSPNLQQAWHLLYSSNTHGSSFSTLLGHILKKGPNIIIVKDKEGHIFGGFSSVSWEFKPVFAGTENCFVFKMSPDLSVHSSTGYNTNYVYLCLHQHTLPNGLGFGGQLNNFGLWIDAEFDHGHSTPACATYQSPLLSSSRQFLVDNVEVWRVGPELIVEKDRSALPTISILDSDMEAKAMMTIAQKIGASDGLRDAGIEGE